MGTALPVFTMYSVPADFLGRTGTYFTTASIRLNVDPFAVKR